MKTLIFSVPGQPVAKGRARSTKSGFHFTPEKTRRYENQVAAYAAEAMRGQPPYGGPVEVVIEAYMMIPASWSLKKRLAAQAGQIKPCVKPDLDNIIKSIADGMNGIAIHDDGQIVRLTATKAYSDTPRLIVTVIWQGE